MSAVSQSAEWLEADGLGGFASGTSALVRTRRYHALLLAAAKPPAARYVLFNGFDAHLRTGRGEYALSAHRYVPGVIHPDGERAIERFDLEPWPRWTFRLGDGTRVQQEIFVVKGAPLVTIAWRLLDGARDAKLTVRPLFSGRDYHALHRENPAFRFEPRSQAGLLRWSPYQGVPGISVLSNGRYEHRPDWYRQFSYEEERERGLDHVEDLASPGCFVFDLARGEALLIAQAEGTQGGALALQPPSEKAIENLRHAERSRRERFNSKLERAADAYIVTRGAGKTIIAGYPWFADWGRDTFIAMRGLCIAGGRFEDARSILREWSRLLSKGMLPNCFPDAGDTPKYNTVDAALWFVIAAYDHLHALRERHLTPEPGDLRLFNQVITDILGSYAKGTRFGIRLDDDGLIACGEPGLQLTWMDAKVGDHVVTPRIGKPVEVQALWINALRVAQTFSDRWNDVHHRALASFERRFWDEQSGYLYDVIDAGHRQGRVDRSMRPNQIYAVGGLPFQIIGGRRAERIVENVESQLYTPVGLRTLARSDGGYIGRYAGDPRLRDLAYHQGTVWPYLFGAFVEAWVRVRGQSAEARAHAKERFVQPLLERMNASGGHLFEIADGDPPHAPRGCPFQAWSVGEAARIVHDLLRD
jgi:predicted glycogen debranching enzyme